MRRVFLIGIVMLYTAMNAEGSFSNLAKIAYRKEKFKKSEQLVMDLAMNFSTNYFQEITDNPLNPRINSPLNTFILESLLSYGAGGTSVEKYHEAIGLPVEVADIATYGYQSMLENLSKYDVNIKTKLFVQEGVKLNPSFEDLSIGVFHAEIERVEVSEGFIDSEKISEFIESQMNQKLRQSFWPQELGCDTNIVLVNTVNFDGTWKIGFNTSDTSPQYFSPFGWDKRKVPTMRTTGRFRHGSTDIDGVKAEFIEIPYESNSSVDAISLFIIMSDVADDTEWKEMIPKLRNTDLNKLLNSTEDELELFIPKLKFVNKAKLTNQFEPEYRPQVPYDKNNISGIFASPGSSIISNSLTKSVIDLDETGLRTAQSTLISYSPRPCDICDTYTQRWINCRAIAAVKEEQCVPKKVTSSDRKTRSAVPQFRVDRPFVGFLMTTGHIFMDIFSINSPGSQFVSGNEGPW